ncbi:hypothetical protein [Kitasatospora sp. MBT66]|uniref:hypothetical protein n=1 Tax=Kitasatospora sp. MBT66 TaxID=1444769 RepID=UPI0005B82D71|nr:hypothetical protein [Kitasatospora sp. MBT66]
MSVDNPRIPAVNAALEKLIADLTPDPFDGRLRRDDAYTVVLAALDHLEGLGQRRTTVGELYIWSRVIPGGETLGGHDRLMTLLEQAADHGRIRLEHGQVHIGDAPTGGGAGHLWMRQLTQGGAHVELIGPEPWPVGAPERDGLATWWHCTGCRHGLDQADGMYVYAVRQQVTDHAVKCSYLPPLPDAS